MEEISLKRFYIYRDGIQLGSTVSRESAVDLIHQYQAYETHPILRAQFSPDLGGTFPAHQDPSGAGERLAVPCGPTAAQRQQQLWKLPTGQPPGPLFSYSVGQDRHSTESAR